MKHICLVFALTVIAPAAQAAVQVFACEPEWAALAVAIGGERVKVFSATTSNQDPHFIEARPSLIAKARRADLLVCSGAGVEDGWLPVLLRKTGREVILPGARGHFMAADQVALLGKPALLDRSLGDLHPAGNPHVHLNPTRLMIIARALTDRLVRIDPSGEANYRARLDNLLSDLQSMLLDLQPVIDSLAGSRFVVHHDSWIYLAEWLGLEQIATIEPRPGVPPNSGYLAELVSRVSAGQVDFILRSNYQNPRASQWLSEHTGVPVRVIEYSPANWETPGALLGWYRDMLNALSGVEATP